MEYKNLIFSIIVIATVGMVYNKINDFFNLNEKKDELLLINKYLISEDKNIKKIMNNKKPKLWIYLNNTVNSYKWETFGSRNTKNLNKEYINLCLSSIINNCGNDFDIMMIDNNSFKLLLNDWTIELEKLSIPYNEYFKTLGLIKLLKNYGGIIIEPNTIMFKSLKPIYDKILMTNKPVTGEFKNDSLNYEEIKLMPSMKFFGSNKNNSILNDLEKFIINITAVDYTNESILLNKVNNLLYDKIKNNKINYIDGKYFGTKDINNKIINLEDLFSDSYLEFNENIYFLYIPDLELSKRNNFNWFIYLDKKEILELKKIFLYIIVWVWMMIY